MEVARGKDQPETLWVLDLLAGVLDRRGKCEEAVKLYREYLNMLKQEESKKALVANCRLCAILQKLGNYSEAQEVSKKVVEMCKVEFGNDHKETLWAIDMDADISKMLRKATYG